MTPNSKHLCNHFMDKARPCCPGCQLRPPPCTPDICKTVQKWLCCPQLYAEAATASHLGPREESIWLAIQHRLWMSSYPCGKNCLALSTVSRINPVTSPTCPNQMSFTVASVMGTREPYPLRTSGELQPADAHLCQALLSLLESETSYNVLCCD